MNWFKFYGQDWLADPKLYGLNAEDRLCFITLLCLASAREEDTIPNITEESLKHVTRLYLDPLCIHKGESNCEWCRATGTLKRLENKGIVRYESNGGSNASNAERYGRVTVCNFTKRQQKYLTGAERQARHRAKKKA